MYLTSDIKEKIGRYCAYQERSQKEVKDKLISLGVRYSEVPFYIAFLIEENFINEERFALALAKGKCNQKKWGSQKIVQALKLHDISDYLIKKSINSLDQETYRDNLNSLLSKRVELLTDEKNEYIKKQKIYRYLYQKGYNSSEITEAIADYFKQNESYG